MWLTEFRNKWHEGTKAKHEAVEAKYRLDNLMKQQSLETRAKEIKDEVFNGIEVRHKTDFPYHLEMAVTVAALQTNYNFKENEQVLGQVLQMLFDEGRLSYDQNENQFIHRL